MKTINWFYKLYQQTDDEKFFDLIGDALDYYEKILEKAEKDCEITNDMEYDIKSLPGYINYYFILMQDLDSIVDLIDLKYKSQKGKKYRFYLEKYNRNMKSSDAEKYAETDEEVIKWLELKNIFINLKNKFLGVVKSLDAKNYQLSNLVKLKTHGFLSDM